MITRLRSAHQPRVHLVLMLVLTFSTGVNDAVGYLGLDRVFTGNMTGNVVILAMALTGAGGLPVLGPAIALGCFLLGALVAGRTLRDEASGWSLRTSGLLSCVAAVMAAVAVALFARMDQVELARYVITGALASAMGLQAATARHLSVKEVTTVVVTSTLTGLAADSRFGANTGTHGGRRLWAVGAIMAGAAAGAALLQFHLGLGVMLSALCTLGVTAAGETARRGHNSQEPAPAT
ncbi:DUF1275 family protein [Paenarthrobacter sp. DKR-5]|uniref:YoaK family protein n=1 Tax=Paenarthrobacter sp. DKR-5 TaxID=2835535 RepID=UPI001BDCB0AD|nr:YoaK family protein [Paenarthrobacter sp. DKR-5]MBT1003798.1 DUF1275 family protein [Paenarthrobacter sp. DKR-5]